jgi:multiple sugar transport system substrate-binding protein
MKKGLLIFVIMILALSVACSSNNNAPANNAPANNAAEKPADDAKEAVEFRVAWWGSTARHELYNTILDEYEKLNPHVTIIREFAGFGDYWDRIATQSAGGNAPDIMELHTQLYGKEYTEKGVLIPLNEYVEKGTINLDGWVKAIADAGMVDGNLYSVSKGVTAAGMIVNVTLIEEAGMQQPPKEGITYEEFRTWALDLQSKLPEGSYVANDVGYSDSMFDTYVRNKGKSMFAPDGKSVGFDLEDVVEFWTYWSELREQGVVPPADITAEYTGMPWENSMFIKRVNAIEFQNTNQGKLYQMYTEDKVDISRLPMVAGAPFGSGENLISSGWGITKDSDPAKREELAKFINWFVNDSFAAGTFNAELGVVGPTHIAEIIKDTIAPTDVFAFEHIATISPDIPVSEPWGEGAQFMRDTYTNTYQKLTYGQLSVQEAAEHFYNTLNKELAK